jgi:hypothetical protein
LREIRPFESSRPSSRELLLRIGITYEEQRESTIAPDWRPARASLTGMKTRRGGGSYLFAGGPRRRAATSEIVNLKIFPALRLQI